MLESFWRCDRQFEEDEEEIVSVSDEICEIGSASRIMKCYRATLLIAEMVKQGKSITPVVTPPDCFSCALEPPFT